MTMTKTVALSDEAYHSLDQLKHTRESFSQIVLRLTKEKQKSVRELFGLWKNDKDMDKIFDKILKERHRYRTREVKF